MEKLWKKFNWAVCKGHELSKLVIKVFYDEYFIHQEIIQEN